MSMFSEKHLVLQVWEAIDAHMDDRRRAIREKKLKEDIEKYRKENPKITEQFADLKRKLAQISEHEWNAIPDIGDYTRHKKNKMDVSYLFKICSRLDEPHPQVTSDMPMNRLMLTD